ncbi:hypothetical protein HPS57_06715 [Prevotella sp. PINT]|uniref:hypothetical protein n=1 Tax=Palleniella intestinalis TaxID=2736291 RepID=UPI001556BCB2|nr:hypothetical protein [Palleniella intestinalis]NPD81664.1 hypothetical protein [Palleniella intestinalis]
MNLIRHRCCKAYTFLYAMMLPALAVLAASCVSDEGTMAGGMPDMAGKAGISLTLSMDGSSAPARAKASLFSATPADGEYSPGEGFENYIEFAGRDFRVYLVDADNKVVCEFDNTMVIPIGDSETTKHYRLNMTLTQEEVENYFIGNKIKVMMLANWRNYPANAVGRTVDDIVKDEAAVFNYTPFGGTLTAGNRIPMFGIAEYSDFTITEGSYNELGIIHLLRAFAKVEVRDKAETAEDTHKIKTVELVRYTDRAAMAPYGVYDQGDYVFGSWFEDYGDISIPKDAEVNGGSAGFVKTDSKTPSFVIYCPEYDNTGMGVTPSLIRVTYEDGRTYDIEFKNYGSLPGMEKDEPFDVKRNNWYKYSLERERATVTVELDVQPYASCSMDAPLGLPRDDMGDLKVYMEKDEQGNLTLPQELIDYMRINNKELPRTANGEELVCHDEIGDYYAIHFTSDGTMENSELWLKNWAGCRVLSNFKAPDPNDQDCSTRQVIRFVGTSEYPEHRDIDGEVRLQHNANHTSIVYDRDGVMIFKNPDTKERYIVESWDSETGIFYITLEETDTKYRFQEYDKTGEPTGNIVEIDKNTGERTERMVE